LIHQLKLILPCLQISCNLKKLRIIIEYVYILISYNGKDFGAVREMGKSGNSNLVKQFTSKPAEFQNQWSDHERRQAADKVGIGQRSIWTFQC